MTLHTLGHPVELDEKAIRDDGDVWTFTGYASIFGSKDLGNDIVVPGAFQKSLREHGLPLILWQHKHGRAPCRHMRRGQGRQARAVDPR